jgi:hypothetical protein
LSAFHLRPLLYNADILQIGLDTSQQLGTQFPMGHLATPEPYSDLSLVALFQKFAQIAHLDLVIRFFRSRTEFDFLELDLFLFLTVSLRLLTFFEPELAEVHNAAHGRRGIGHDLDQIEIGLLSFRQGLFYRDLTTVFTILINQSYNRYGDLIIQAILFCGTNLLTLQNSMAVINDLLREVLNKLINSERTQIFT